MLNAQRHSQAFAVLVTAGEIKLLLSVVTI